MIQENKNKKLVMAQIHVQKINRTRSGSYGVDHKSLDGTRTGSSTLPHDTVSDLRQWKRSNQPRGGVNIFCTVC